MKKNRRKHADAPRAIRRAVPKLWKGRQPKSVELADSIPIDRRKLMAARIAKATGWSQSWVEGLDDPALKRLAQKYI